MGILKAQQLVDSVTYTEQSCGWCCKVATYQFHTITLFSDALSLILIGMFLFILINIAINYYKLQKEREATKNNETSLKSFLASTSTYATIQETHSINTADLKLNKHNKKNKQYSLIDTDDDIVEIPNNKNMEKSRAKASDRHTRNSFQSVNAATAKFHKPKKITQSMRKFHFLYLLLAGGWFLLQAVVLLSSSESYMKYLFDIILYEGHGLIENIIVIFAFFKDDSPRNIILSVILGVLLMASFSLTAFTYKFYNSCPSCSFFYPAPQAFYTYILFLVFYIVCLALSYTKSPIKPRKTVRIWMWYLFSIYLFAVVGAAGCLYTPDKQYGYCIMDVVSILYALLFAPLLYFTLNQDSFDLFWNTQMERANAFSTVNPMVARAHDLVERHSVGWIPYEQIRIGERLGYGSAGEVNQGFFLQTPVAIKRLFDNKSQALEDFFKEVTLMSKLSHPNIVLFMGVCVRDNGDRYIITEMMSKGSVFDLIHPNLSFSAIRDPEADNELTAVRVKQIILQSARGMAYLHSFKPPILHRDLKSHNLLVDNNWNVKLADFGLSRAQSLNTMTAAGTPQWSAPEVIRQDHYTTKADVYSFAIIIYELLSKKIPYENIGPLTAARQVAYDNLRPHFPEGCDPLYMALARECWNEVPEARPDFTVITKRIEELPPPVLPVHRKVGNNPPLKK